MKILSLFDESGIMVKPWVEAGIECTIVDALHPPGVTEGNPRRIGTDLSTWEPDQHYDVIFAFPPCTYLCRPASMHWPKYGGRTAAVSMGIELVKRTLEIIALDAPLFWLIENPTGQIPKLWRKWDFKFNPGEFGGWMNPPVEAYTKETCLWFSPGFPTLERREAPRPWKRHYDWIAEIKKTGYIKRGQSVATDRSKTPQGFSYAVFHALYPVLLDRVGGRRVGAKKRQLAAVGKVEALPLLTDLQKARTMLERDLIMDQIREAALYNEISGEEYYEALQVCPPGSSTSVSGLTLPSGASHHQNTRVAGGLKLGPLGAELMRLRGAMAKAAQAVYDDWEQDDEGFDCELGSGGVCDQIASALWATIDNKVKGVPFQIRDGGQDGDNHAYLLVYNDKEIYEVDIPMGLYETGSGYHWVKRPGVKFRAVDVGVNPLNRDDFRGDAYDLESEVGRTKKSTGRASKGSQRFGAVPQKSIRKKGTRVGARSPEEVLSDPQAKPQELEALAPTHANRVVQHPNCPPELFATLAVQFPLEAMESPVIDLWELETPKFWAKFEAEHVDDLIRWRFYPDQPGQMPQQRISTQQCRLFAADCAAHVLPIFEKVYPSDKRPRNWIEAARACARGQISEAELKGVQEAVPAIPDPKSAAPGERALYKTEAARLAFNAALMTCTVDKPKNDHWTRIELGASCPEHAARAVGSIKGSGQNLRTLRGDFDAYEKERLWQWHRLLVYLRAMRDGTVVSGKKKTPPARRVGAIQLWQGAGLAQLLSVGAKPKWSDPSVKAEDLVKQAPKVPRTYSNPNLPLDALIKGAEKYPLYVEQNPVLSMLQLEDPVTVEKLKEALAKGWLTVIYPQLSPESKRLFAADCAEHVLHFFEKKFPGDKRPRQAIDAARLFANSPATVKSPKAMTSAAAAAWSSFTIANGGQPSGENAPVNAVRAAIDSANNNLSATQAAAYHGGRAARESVIFAGNSASFQAAHEAAYTAEKVWQGNRVRFYYAQQHPEYQAPQVVGVKKNQSTQLASIGGNPKWNTREDKELYERWRSLVNMTEAQLRRFLQSKEGKEAGLSRAEASKQGIRSGQDSARAILRMIPNSKTLQQAYGHWSKADWEWAKRQVSFISRMRGNAGPLYDEQGRPTRKLTSLLLWGHDPRKRN